jgi:carboxylate-amine ligase
MTTEQAVALRVGVEEEFHLVDLLTRRPVPSAARLLQALPEGDSFHPELQRSVIETNSAPWDSLGDLRTELAELRATLISTANAQGVGVVAAGTTPIPDPAAVGISPVPRFVRMQDDYQLLVGEQLICGVQVHVDVENRQQAVDVAGRMAADLPALLALSASSPFWSGADTGYASSRTLLWSRWPTAGTLAGFRDVEEYDAVTADLLRSGVIYDEGMLYYDVRPSAHAPTLELRICDACPRLDTVVLIAGIYRALVAEARQAAAEGVRARSRHPNLLQAATWQAARFSLSGRLVDLSGQHPVPRPARQVIEDLIQRLRPYLLEYGDWTTIEQLAMVTLNSGGAAAQQRTAFNRNSSLADVVDQMLYDTASTEPPNVRAVHPGIHQPGQEGALSAAYPDVEGDEAIHPGGRPVPLYRPMITLLERLGATTLRDREHERDARQAADSVVFAAMGEKRPFQTDLVPRLIAMEEWSALATGLEQRVRALEAFLCDIYGPRRAIADGVVSRHLIESAPGFRPGGVLVPSDRVRAVVTGVDVVRGADGRLLVLEDNLRVPSGLAFALQARRLTQSVMPELVVPDTASELDGVPEALRQALQAVAPPGLSGEPQLALLSAGPKDSAWWEHRLLAREMGVPLLLPEHLAFVDGAVFDVSEARPRRLDVIYRRLDEEHLEHAKGADGKRLGPPLHGAVQSGTITMANGLGNGVADDKSVYALVPHFIEYYLGEKPLIDSVPTYLCADPDSAAEVLDRLAELVLKPVDGYGGVGVLIGPDATRQELATARQELQAAPGRWVAQDVVALSTTPVLSEGLLHPRHVDLRVFVVLGPGTGPGVGRAATVLPAPFTRVAPEGSLVVNSSQGGGAKDTWLVP